MPILPHDDDLFDFDFGRGLDFEPAVDPFDPDLPIAIGRGARQPNGRGVDIWDWPEQARERPPPNGHPRPGVYRHDLPEQATGRDKRRGLTLHDRPERGRGKGPERR